MGEHVVNIIDIESLEKAFEPEPSRVVTRKRSKETEEKSTPKLRKKSDEDEEMTKKIKKLVSNAMKTGSMEIPIPKDMMTEDFLKLISNKMKFGFDDFFESTPQVSSHLNMSVEFSFENEVGTGTGPTLEFYDLICEKLVSEKKIFSKDSDDRYGFEGTTLKDTAEAFRLVGRLMGRSFLDGRQLPLMLTQSCYKSIFSKSEASLDKIDDPILKQSLAKLADVVAKNQSSLDGCEIEDLCLSFPEFFSELKQDVTKDNLKTYLEATFTEKLVANHILPAFYVKHGLQEAFATLPKVDIEYKLNGEKNRIEMSLTDLSCFEKLFSGDEGRIGLLFAGEAVENWTKQELSVAIRPGHGYETSSTQIEWLIEFLVSLPIASKKQFWKFTTGSPNCPLGGLKSLDPALKIVKKVPESEISNVDIMLPSAMTCQNYLKLPEYSSKEILEKKMLYAMQEGSQHFLLS